MYFFQEDPFEDASREWASTDSNSFQKNNNSVKGTQNIFISLSSFCKYINLPKLTSLQQYRYNL